MSAGLRVRAAPGPWHAGPVDPIDRVGFHLREAARIAPGRPAALLGVRTALALAAPLLCAPWIGTGAATWAGLAGFGVAIVDKGGAYRARARTMGAAALGGAIAVLVGGLASTFAAAAIPVTLIWTGACAFAGVWGPAAVSAGTSIAVQLTVAMALPIAPALAWTRGAAFLGGGAWAMVLALLFWPVRVYKPARHAIARTFRGIGAQAGALVRGPDIGGEAWRATVARSHRGLRDALETARQTLAVTRRGRGEAGRGERLLVLVQVGDRLLGALFALEEVVASMAPAARGPIITALAPALAEVATWMAAIAERVIAERRLPPAPAPTWDAAAALAAAGAALAAADVLARAQQRHAAELVTRLVRDGALAADVAQRLDGAGPAAPDVGPAPDDPPPARLEQLRAAVDLDAVFLRHALRVGIVAAASVALTRALAIDRGYWTTLTAMLLLQPHAPATMTKGLQRVGGTVLGGALAALLVATVHDPVAIFALVIGLAGMSAAVLQLNYGLYALFLTPTFVLLAEASLGDWRLAELRVIHTLLGAALATIGALVLWPSRERTRFPALMATALAAARGLLEEVVGAAARGAPSPAPPVVAARRRLGLALNNAEASFERVVAELGPGAPTIEPRMALLLYGRRFGTSVVAFATVRAVAATADHAVALSQFCDAVVGALDGLVAAVRDDTAPPPLPDELAALIARIDEPLIAASLQRLEDQLGVLHAAAIRSAAASHA
jgi:uncharacterized membrane protein YccC